jgi:hypothetical protein
MKKGLLMVLSGNAEDKAASAFGQFSGPWDGN